MFFPFYKSIDQHDTGILGSGISIIYKHHKDNWLVKLERIYKIPC